MALEVSGVRLAVEGATEAIKNLKSYNAALEASQKTQDKLAKATDIGSNFSGKAFNDLIQGATKSKGALDALGGSKISGFLQQLSTSFPGITQGLTSLGEKAMTAFPALGSLTGGMQGLAAASPAVVAGLATAAAAIVGVAIAAQQFFALGSRGASLEPIISAFGNIVQGSEGSTEALNKLREQTRGTISDVELMRLSVASLKGTSSTFRSVVSDDLGTIIDLTGRIAQASGDSADIVREKFLLGLRRQSAKLVDDVGVTVDAAKAYEAYAKSIGVATSALTDQQKQAAFAQEAIKQLKVIGEEVGTPASTLENLKAPAVALENTLNKLALAVQPLFAPIAATIADIAHGFENLASFVIPLVASGFQVLGTIFTTLQSVGNSIFTALFGDIIQVASVALPYLVAAAQLALEGFSAVISAIGSIATGLIDTFGSIFPSLGDTAASEMDSLAFRVASGGGKIVGSFAAGMLQGGSKVISAATKIANLVADFLQGFSPPKMGPLSKIDQGGTNVINAWAEGFLKANLKPVDQVSKDVNDQLGAIGKLSSTQVASQLASLDKALQPFNDQLTLAKATLEQVSGFTDPALKAIERQTEKALKAGDAAKIQELDQQAEALKQLEGAEQDRVDNAELQLALVKSQQARERALLGIQQARVGVAKELAQATGGGGGGGGGGAERAAKEEKPKAGKGGETSSKEESSGGFKKGAAPDLLSSEAITKAREQLKSGFAAGLEGTGYEEALAGFESNAGQLKGALDRIKTADPLAGISKKLDPVKDAFSDLQTAIETVKGGIQTALDGISSGIGTALGESGVGALAIKGINESIEKFGTTIDTVKGTVDTALTSIADSFTTKFGEDGSVRTALNSLVGEGGILGTGGLVQTAFSALFGEEGLIPLALTSLESKFTTFVTNIALTLGTFKKGITDLIETPVTTAATTISDTLSAIKEGFTAFASGDLGLGGLATALLNSFVTPFVNAVNGVIASINEAFTSFANAVGASTLAKFINIDIPQIPSVSVPAFAGGAMGFKGSALVGERGAELVNFSKPANIFPAPLTNAIMQLAARPMPMMIDNNGGRGGSNTYNNQRSVSSTFNVGSPEQARLLEKQRAAFNGF